MIRLATQNDVDAVVDIFIASRSEAMPWLDQDLSPDRVTPWLLGLVEADTTWVYDDNGVLGFMTVHADALLLENLYVHPSVQGRGIGTELLANAIAIVPNDLSLWAFKRNESAIAFYTSHGFAEVEETDGSRNEEHEPDVRLLFQS